MRSTLAAAVVLTLAVGLQAGETLLSTCPVSLTNPDGQALDLERYELRVAVHGRVRQFEALAQVGQGIGLAVQQVHALGGIFQYFPRAARCRGPRRPLGPSRRR